MKKVITLCACAFLFTACQQTTSPNASAEKPPIVKKTEKLCERLGCRVTYEN